MLTAFLGENLAWIWPSDTYTLWSENPPSKEGDWGYEQRFSDKDSNFRVVYNTENLKMSVQQLDIGEMN